MGMKAERNPQIFVALLPELVQAYGDLLSTYLREGIAKVIEVDWRELNKLPKDAVEKFYAIGKQHRKGVRVSPEVYAGWEAIPRLERQGFQGVFSKSCPTNQNVE
jgi:hypothetical protein